ncbi:MAG: hypothetical protein Q8Q31_03785 [Nanoarchaeota archaeon]|nr:hypothetical protein [Nanoarchaeota archaeon]
MRKTKTDNKPRFFGLYGLAYRRLEECSDNRPDGFIPFPDVFEKLCRSFSIRKNEAWELLFTLRDFGFINIVATKGVILYTI